MATYIGVDIGGTSTRIGLFSALEHPEFTLVSRFPTLQNYDQQVEAIIAAIGDCNCPELGGIGVSIGGRMAKDGRSVLVAPNLSAYTGRPLGQDLADQFACPVRLAHDTVCGLLAEKRFGALCQSERCAYLTLSTGTGAAIQLGKAQTVLTISIEFGHQLLDGNMLVCLCGQVGCLETQTGGRQLELRLGYATEHITDVTFWEHFCAKMALGLVNLVQLTRVEDVAISGGIALHNSFLLPLLRQQVAGRLRGAPLALYPAVTGENAPLIGAVSLLTTTEDSIVH